MWNSQIWRDNYILPKLFLVFIFWPMYGIILHCLAFCFFDFAVFKRYFSISVQVLIRILSMVQKLKIWLQKGFLFCSFNCKVQRHGRSVPQVQVDPNTLKEPLFPSAMNSFLPGNSCLATPDWGWASFLINFQPKWQDEQWPVQSSPVLDHGSTG